MSARYRRTVDLNLAAPLDTLMSHSMPAQWQDPTGVSGNLLGHVNMQVASTSKVPAIHTYNERVQ